MLAGQMYDCRDPELMKIWNSGKNLMQKYNSLDYSDKKGQLKILDNLLGSRGEQIQTFSSSSDFVRKNKTNLRIKIRAK